MQDCNYRIIDASNTVIFQTNNTNRGSAPCRLQVLDTGVIVIVDAADVVWNINGQPVAATPTSGTLNAGQLLSQASPSAAWCTPCTAGLQLCLRRRSPCSHVSGPLPPYR